MLGNGLKLGVDVGNTHTDAAVVDQDGTIIAVAKVPSTADVGSGILAVLDRVLAMAEVAPSAIRYVMVSSTHCARALATRTGLARTAVIRLCQNGVTGVPPFTGWPEDLKRQVSGKWYLARGGCDFDGRPLSDPDPEEIRRILLDVKHRRLKALAVVASFSPVNPEHEQLVAGMAREILGADFPVTMSHEVGQLGLIERENSAILNAALAPVSREAAEGLLGALEERGIRAEVYYAQNDGTVVSLEYGVRLPVLTIGCGYANAFRGAGHLAGLNDCIVVDIGGTTVNVGVLLRGFPLESRGPSEALGVRTNFGLPFVVSVPLGGGSVIRVGSQIPDKGKDAGPPGREFSEELTVGPDSVGHELPKRALAWGGDTFTLTDAALRLGRLPVADPRCDPERLRWLDEKVCLAALERVREAVEDCIDLARPSEPPLPVVLVGGAAPMVPDDLRGASRVVRPPHYQFAAAVGAASAQVGGGVNVMWYPDQAARERAVVGAAGRAVEKAIEAGAAPGTVQVLEVEELPLTYLPERVVRVRVRAAGSVGGSHGEKDGQHGRK